MVRVPTHEPPTTPGEMLVEEFLRPLGMTQEETAKRLGISLPRLNQVIKGKRAVTPDTALRLERLLGMSAGFWLNLQQRWDLWEALQAPTVAEIRNIRPVVRPARRVRATARRPLEKAK